MSSRSNGSPIIKTVFQAKRKLWSVPAPWSTIDQSTIGKTSVEVLKQDWSEDDSETDGYDPEEESGMESPEHLREAHLQPSQVCLPSALQSVSRDCKIQLARSPAIESLGDLLNIKNGKFRLLHSSASSSSSEEFNLSLPSKMSQVLTSTMMVGGKEREQDMFVEDISVIKTRESLDPRLSVHPSKSGTDDKSPDQVSLGRKCGGPEQLGVSAVSNLPSRPVKLLSSIPARSGRRKMWPPVQSGHSLGLSSIQSSEAGGSKLVPRVDREMVTEEKVEQTEDDTWYFTEEAQPIKQSLHHTASPTIHQSPHAILIHDSVPGPVPNLPLHVCQYPPPPHAGAVCVTMSDYQTLNNGTFLNDIIIDFYLTYMFREMLSQQQQEKLFIFSSYFFKRLSTDPVEGSMMANMEKDSKLSLAHKRHMRVLHWTKTANLSTKQVVIFPICKDSHWFLVTAVLTGEEPFLVVMDSLGGDNKEVADMIKEYLVIELSNQMGDKNLLEVKEMRVVWPCLPQQDNYTDCGVFLLHYVEKMLKSPNEILLLEDQDFVNWFPKYEVNTKRSSLVKLVRQMAEDQALPGQVAVFPVLFGEEVVESEEARVATFEEEEVTDNDISIIVKAELSNMSPPTNRSKTVQSSDTSGEIFSAVVHKTQTTVVVSCSTTARGPSRKRFRLANTRQAPTQLSMFSQAEYYRGKTSSERRFDQLLEEEKDDVEVISH